MNKGKIVCFAGHRFNFRVSVKYERLINAIESLIKKGYTRFYSGSKGVFDDICEIVVNSLKMEYPYIRLYRISTTPYIRKHDECIFDKIIVPNLEEVHYKQRIVKRNEWMVEHSDLVLCNITNDVKSGAYNTVKYARKIGKPIIYLD